MPSLNSSAALLAIFSLTCFAGEEEPDDDFRIVRFYNHQITKP